ncbi:MAG: hypothetical protein JWQ43_236 [Glaciihabitans sp.]|nr:hypothetical protein [Glaciihabitans sp.]
MGQRRRGRPRNGDVNATILAATLDLLVEYDDPDDITITAIVRRSGASRASLYRRWDGRDTLLAEALSAVDEAVEFHSTGEPVADILAFFSSRGNGGDRLQNLISKRHLLMARNPHLRESYDNGTMTARHRSLRAGLDILQVEGVLSSSVDSGALVDLFYGVQHLRAAMTPGGDPSEARLRAAIETVLRPYLRESHNS